MQNKKQICYKRLYPYFAAFAFITAFAVYLPALDGNFLSWDDLRYVTGNVNIRSLDYDFIKWVFTGTVLGNWHPLTMLSHAVDYAIYGPENPFGHHLTSVLIHAVNSALVFACSVELIRRAIPGESAGDSGDSGFTPISAGLVTALLFASHPLHVESVAWISERKDLLCALFYLLTVISYLKYTRAEGRSIARRYAVTLILFLLALMSKPMAVTLPVVLVILDVYPLRRLSVRTFLLEKAPFFLLTVVFSLVTLWAQKLGGAVSSTSAISLSERIGVAAWGYFFYIYKTVLPIELAPLYPYPRGLSLFSVTYGGALILLTAVTALSVLTWKKRPWLTASWAYYLVTLLPVIGLVQVGMQSAADRYSYIAGIVLFLLIGLSVSAIITRYAPARRLSTLIVVTLLPVSLLCAKTIAQSGVWHDTITLWSHEIEIYPEASALPYNNRGREYLDIVIAGGVDSNMAAARKALKDFSKAIELDSRFNKSFTNRGLLYMESGNLALAEADLDRSIEINKGQMAAYNGRGLLYKRTSRPLKALSDFTKAIELEPRTPGPYSNRGLLYKDLGELGKATDDFNAAIALDRRNTPPLINRGILFFETGRFDEAIKDFTDVITLEPNSAIAYNNRGGVLLSSGKSRLAIVDLTKALELDNTLTDAYLNLSLAYENLGDTKRAKVYYKKYQEVTRGVDGTH